MIAKVPQLALAGRLHPKFQQNSVIKFLFHCQGSTKPSIVPGEVKHRLV